MDHRPNDPGTVSAGRREWKLFAIPAVLALVGYVLLFGLDSWLRTRRGPWEVAFLREPDGVPALRITQGALGLKDVTIRFEGETVASEVALPEIVRFDAPGKALPFGSTAFDDLMYQPGTVVLHCFGHEVQLLPRALYLNRREYPWQSGERLRSGPSDKLPTLEPPKDPRGRIAPPTG